MVYVSLSEPCEGTPICPAFSIHTDGKDYFDDGDLYVKGFSSEDQDHAWELSEKSVISLEFGSDKYVN